VILAEVNGDVAGFALFFHNYSTFLTKPGVYLEDLFVKPEHRGAGVGRLLLQRLAEIALERGCGRLEWAVLNWNTPAIGFYERLGAKPMNDWTVFRVTGDALAKLGSGTLPG
jgi:GNAT superfamily N-acetyltransferase